MQVELHLGALRVLMLKPGYLWEHEIYLVSVVPLAAVSADEFQAQAFAETMAATERPVQGVDPHPGAFIEGREKA